MGSGYVLVEEAPSVEDYNRVRFEAGLRVKEPDAVRAGLANSVYAVRVEHDGEVVGIGRVIGDGALFFEIVDMAVLPEYQGNGLGDGIMAALMTYLHEHARPGSFVGLFAGEGVSSFYEKYGFESRSVESPGMYTVIV